MNDITQNRLREMLENFRARNNKVMGRISYTMQQYPRMDETAKELLLEIGRLVKDADDQLSGLLNPIADPKAPMDE